jgi:hypothetical protein
MVVFPNATAFYSTWQRSLESRGVKIRLNTPLVRVLSRGRDGVRVVLGSRQGHGPGQKTGETVRIDRGQGELGNESEEHFDEIVFCTLADKAKELLGKNASFMERRVLGNTRWSDDITVTHNVC